MPDELSQLADDALDNLVHQFARPMDFIRELVQNSIDAGTPRIEVWVDWNPPEAEGATGMLEIHVDDFGEGMDEAIIDAQLTRMFSSTKENDLTKIGKFGIGFTSVFAIQPSAVLVQTGRHGESWELLFHPDRSFDKVRLDTAVRGTQITVYKALDPGDVDGTIGELRWVLSYWCEHSDVPILFSDRRGDAAAPSTPEGEGEESPWGAFSSGSEDKIAHQAMAQPMDLDTQVKVRLERDGVEVVVGYLDTPSYGFFNGGITLIRSTDPDCLGPSSRRCSHISFKVKSRQLEHTLTRDNVLQDHGWARALDVVDEAWRMLRHVLVDHVEAAVASGASDLGRWQRFLAVEYRVRDGRCMQPDVTLERALLRDWRGQPLTVATVCRQAEKWKAFLLAPDSPAMSDRLEAQGLHLLEASPSAIEMLTEIGQLGGLVHQPFLSQGGFTADVFPVPVPADSLLVVPDPVPRASMTDVERLLLKSTEQVLDKGSGMRCSLHLVSLGVALGDASVPFATLGDPDTAIRRIRQKPGFLQTINLLTAEILINRDHPMWPILTTVAAQYPLAARMGMTQAIAEACGLRSETDDLALSLVPLEAQI